MVRQSASFDDAHKTTAGSSACNQDVVARAMQGTHKMGVELAHLATCSMCTSGAREGVEL